MKRLFIIVLFILFSISCGKQMGDIVVPHRWQHYKIKSGEHRSKESISIFKGTELRFLAVFDASAIYTLTNQANQGDNNKLFGFSDCGDTHQTNSARFGWRWYNNELQIFAYCYKDKNMSFKYMTSINIDQEYEYKINIEDNKYIFTVNGIVVDMDRGCSDKGGIKYYLLPYFGGDEVAPHDITIKIKDL